MILKNDLGVLFDPKLNFTNHITRMVSKAKSMLGFMKRISYDFDDLLALKSIYCALVRSQLEFGSVVWSPFYGAHINKIEAVQKNFARYILWKCKIDASGYNSRLELLNMKSLEKRRNIAAAVFATDIISSRVDSSYLLSLMQFKFSAYSTSLRSKQLLNLNHQNSNYSSNSPINNMCRLINAYGEKFDYNLSRNEMIKVFKEN